MAQKSKKTFQSKKKIERFNIPLTRNNFIIFAVGILFIFIGFFVMTLPPWNSSTSLFISPIILCIGYFLVFPYGIFAKKSSRSTKVLQ